MHILKLIYFSAIFLPLAQLPAEARNIENQSPVVSKAVSKADFIQQNQWQTKASFLLAQQSSDSSNDSQVADNSWTNSEEEAQTPAEVLSNLQQIRGADFAPYRGAPGFTIANPYGFGADGGNFYVGLGYTPITRGSQDVGEDDGDAIMGFGVGLGNASKAVGVEINYTLASFGFNRNFGAGGFSAKVHRTISPGWGVALGYNGFLNTGDANDFEDSVYLATTKIFSTREKLNSAFSRVAMTVGVGNGEFRTEDAIEDDEEGFNVFGSLAFRIARPISGVIEWTGQDLAVGTSVSPFKRIPVTFNLGLRDIIGAGDGARFVFGVGAGF